MAERSKLPYVSIARVLSMLMILGCHIIGYYTFIPGYSFLGQVLNVGVEVFFVISGYLYGVKNVEKTSRWIVSRIKRIWIPVFLFVVIDLICLRCISHIKVSTKTTTVFLLNLQGLSFIWEGFSKLFPTSEAHNITHLWFTTVILLCYLLIPICQNKRIKEKVKWLNGTYTLPLFTAISIAIIIICEIVYGLIGVTLGYFAVFLIGYGLRNVIEKRKQITCKYLLWLTLLTLALQLGRVFLRRYIDGTQIYEAYVGISHNVLGLFIFVLIIAIYEKWTDVITKISTAKVISAIDGLSFYIYIVHGLFFREPWNVYTDNRLGLATLEFFSFTILCAYGLKWLTENVNKNIDKISIRKERA